MSFLIEERAQGESRAVLSRDCKRKRKCLRPLWRKPARIGVTQPGQSQSTVAERGVGRELSPVVCEPRSMEQHGSDSLQGAKDSSGRAGRLEIREKEQEGWLASNHLYPSSLERALSPP